MRGRASLERAIGRRFALALFVLYGIVATAVWRSESMASRQFAALTLKNEAEVLASYLAASGRLDAPELESAEEEPMKIWLRVRSGDRIVAATPGTPDLPVETSSDSEEVVQVASGGPRGRYLLVGHAVGGRGRKIGGDLVAEAIGSLDPVIASQRRLGLGLGVLGLVVIPIAALGGRLIARRALSPISSLVEEIRQVDASVPTSRLGVPERSVEEVAVLAITFNDLLDRLARSLDTMRRFTADASHEIRNPLSVLRTGIEVALRRERPAEEYRALLAENLQEILHLQAVLEGLLALARAEPGKEPQLRRREVDLHALTGETVERLAAISAERGLDILNEVASGLTLQADEQALRLVLFNLLDNALKHGAAGEPVRVTAVAEPARILLRVSNGGPAIPPEQREHLFDRYFRGDSSRPGIGGLGLSVVRWAAEAHGGSVRLDPAAPGTCFEVALPRS